LANLLAGGYIKLLNAKATIRNGSLRVLKENRGQITVEQVLWIIFIVVILCGVVYGFISGWFTELLNSMKETTNEKLETVIN